MIKTETLEVKKLRNIIRGACFLGSGGGGGYDVSMKFVDKFSFVYENNENKVISYISIDDIKKLPDKKNCVVVAYMGSPEKMKTVKYVDAAVNAVRKLSKQILKHENKIDYILPVEVGPISSIVACLVASELGIPVIDADGAGRAVPTLDLISYSGNTSISPTVLSSEKDGNTHHDVILQISDGCAEGSASKMESLARPILSMPEYNQRAGLALWYFDDVRLLALPNMCVPGTLTFCEKLGTVIAEQQASKAPDIKQIIEFFRLQDSDRSVKVVCSGILEDVTTGTAGGFDHGIITISNDYTTYKIIYQNESLLLWDSSAPTPLVMAPDLIAYLINAKENDDETYRWVYSNDDIIENNQLKASLKGKEITVMGIQAPKELIHTEEKVSSLRAKMLSKYKYIRPYQTQSESTLPQHYMAILNNLGYYGSYIPLK